MRSWLLALGLVAVAASTTGALVAHSEAGPRPPGLSRISRPQARGCRARRPNGGAVELAGSGSNLPLTRRLAAAFMTREPGVRLVVHPSIGTTGGLRALRDGVIDVALASRPLAPEERRGLRLIPYARVAVVVAADPDVPDEGVTREQLVRMYAGARSRWRDGRPLEVLQRERGDSSHRAFERLLPAFARANRESWRRGRFPVLYSDAQMQAALMSTPGAVGLLDLGAVVSQQLPLSVLAVDGVTPTAATVRSGRYPYVKDLTFVLPGAPRGAVRAFIRLARGSMGRALARRNGYVPLPEPGPEPGPGPESTP